MNAEGIPRKDLSWVLKRPDLVKTAKRIDKCLLCRRSNVNDAGLCDICTAALDDAEIKLVERWMRGDGP